jgi:hypothetical protein
MSHEIAKAAVEEAKLLLNSEGEREDVADALNLALKDLREPTPTSRVTPGGCSSSSRSRLLEEPVIGHQIAVCARHRGVNRT